MDRRLKKKGHWESVKGVQDCSVGVNITVIKGKKFGTVDNQQLNTGWLLNIVLHNTGLTVHNSFIINLIVHCNWQYV